MSLILRTAVTGVVLALLGCRLCVAEEATSDPVYLSLRDDAVVYQSISDLESPSDGLLVDEVETLPATPEATPTLASVPESSKTSKLELPTNDSGSDERTALTAALEQPQTSMVASTNFSPTAVDLPSEVISDPRLVGCDDGCIPLACDACPTACGTPCGRTCPACCGRGMHRTSFYGEVLYLRARNGEVAYAVPADGPIGAGQPTPIQVGSLGVLDPEYDLGFRAGLNVALDTVSSLDVRFTVFESMTHDNIVAAPTDILRSLVTHPSTLTAADDALAGSGTLEIDFDTLDLVYRHLAKCSDVLSVNYVLGARYGKLEQQFAVQFEKNGTEFVSSNVDFEGAGIRLGLESARFSCRNQLHVYANGYANFLAGRFRNSYFQGDSFDQEVVNVVWETGRLVPVLDLECGIGWTSSNGNLRLSAGYLVSSWLNAVVTRDAIDAVQRNDYRNLAETITFDGLQAGVEYRF